MKDHYPLLSVVVEMALVLPVSNVWPERAASILKWQKNRLRSKVKNDLLSSLLHISLNDPDIASPTYKQFMPEIVEMWLPEKKRRKLPKQKPPPWSVTCRSFRRIQAPADNSEISELRDATFGFLRQGRLKGTEFVITEKLTRHRNEPLKKV